MKKLREPNAPAPILYKYRAYKMNSGLCTETQSFLSYDKAQAWKLEMEAQGWNVVREDRNWPRREDAIAT